MQNRKYILIVSYLSAAGIWRKSSLVIKHMHTQELHLLTFVLLVPGHANKILWKYTNKTTSLKVQQLPYLHSMQIQVL